MRVSVVVPVYNVAEFLDECLRSVLGEADGDVELICVDDGSTDASGEMLDMAARQIAPGGCTMKVIHQENAGAGAARNAALSAVTGDWIMFLDGDDVFARGWLSAVRALAARHASADMVGFGRTESWPVDAIESIPSREVDVTRVVGFDVYERGMWQYAYRRDLVAGLEFKRIVRVEDKLFQGEALLRARRVALTDTRMYGYRQREGSVAHSNWNRANFGAELAWRIMWLESMSAAGKTMDRRLWRFMGLCFLEYIPYHMRNVPDPSLRSELEARWFETLRAASAYGFAPWQRGVMWLLAATRSRAAAWLLCRLPPAVKQMLGRYHPLPPRKRLLFCGVGFGHGGLSRAFLPVARTLEEAGYEVKVLVPYAADAGRLDVPGGYETGPAFRWKVSGLWTGRALRLFHLLTGGRFRFLGARRVPHDAFVVFGASCCMDWCGYSKKPTWGFLHSAPVTGHSDALRPWIVRAMRRSAARCRGIFAVSSAMNAAWRAIGIDSNVLQLPRATRALGAANGPRDARQCVCVGRLSWEKGQDRLLAAVAKTPGVSLTFVGDGPTRAALTRQTRELELEDRVSFAGWREDPTPFLASAGLVVNASRSEGLPLAVLEALEAGAPVLATDIPGNREALSGGRYGRLVPDSAAGLAAGLAAYLDDAHSCDPEIGFDRVRDELRSVSCASAERLAQIGWTK